MKKTVTMLCLLTLVMAAVAAAVYALEPPEEVTIDAAVSKTTAVVFPHAKHVKKLNGDCRGCHHKDEALSAEANVKVQHCSKCHLDPEANMPGMREVSLKKNPFHMICVECHLDEGAGPNTCDDCHVK